MRRYSIIILVIFAVSVLAHAATIIVPDDYLTIQEAIDAATDGDEVLVLPGTYGGGINFKGKTIIVKSSSGPGVTVIAGGSSSVVEFNSDEGINSVLAGFTVTGVYAFGSGGGIVCYHSSPTVIGNIISDNEVYWDSGGDNGANPNLSIAAGGGIYLRYSSPRIINNVICGNVVWGEYGGVGGGILANFNSSPVVTNTTIYQNFPDGLVSANGSSPLITNAIINNGVSGGGNPVITYSNIQGGWPGKGNIDSDPLFVDEFNGDFHLTFNSPCRGSGDNSAVAEPTDFEGNPRSAYGTVDMGADEFYTHLYWTGDAIPGGNVEIKFVGLPGTSPVCLCIGTGVLDPPLKSMWGDWNLQFPIIGPIGFLPIPSPDGVLIIPGTIPASPPPPYSLPMQALIGVELSNLCVLEVK